MLSKVIAKQVITICICAMLDKYFNAYYNWFVDKNAEYDNFEDNLEGVLVLYDKGKR